MMPRAEAGTSRTTKELRLASPNSLRVRVDQHREAPEVGGDQPNEEDAQRTAPKAEPDATDIPKEEPDSGPAPERKES